MRSILFAAGVAFLSAAAPTCAGAAPVLNATGAEFLERCTNPPLDRGDEIVAMCEMYVAGIADGLQTSGRACFDPRVTRARPLPVALTWLRNHMRYRKRPADFMISNGLVNAFPCRVTATQQQHAPNAEDQMERFAKLVEFLKAAKWALAAMGVS